MFLKVFHNKTDQNVKVNTLRKSCQKFTPRLNFSVRSEGKSYWHFCHEICHTRSKRWNSTSFLLLFWKKVNWKMGLGHLVTVNWFLMKHHRFVNVSTIGLKFFVCKSIVDYINIWQKLLQQKNSYPKFKHEMTHELVQMTHFDYQTIVPGA